MQTTQTSQTLHDGFLQKASVPSTLTPKTIAHRRKKHNDKSVTVTIEKKLHKEVLTQQKLRPEALATDSNFTSDNKKYKNQMHSNST